MTSPLISAEQLQTALGSVTVLDVRYALPGGPAPQEYVAGHVPGAAYVDLDTALAGTPGPRGRHPLPPPEAFGRAMRAAGVCADRPVVVLDDWQGFAAARCRWLLRHHSHQSVRLLDGGWRAWLASGGEVETGEPDITPGDFEAQPGRLLVCEVDAVLEATQVGVLVDARAPERFRGEVEPIDPVGGHVPGAVNLPTAENLTEAGRFRAVDELADRFAAAGVSGQLPVTVYCGSGVTAAHELLALELVGIEAALYPGSWSEWVADPRRPVATGD